MPRRSAVTLVSDEPTRTILSQDLKYVDTKLMWLPYEPAELYDVSACYGYIGFIGSPLLSRVLAEFLQARVYCLVRGMSPSHCLERVVSACECLHVDVEATAWDRVVGVPGDIAKQHFGLSAAGYDELLHTIDTVLHFAARDNFFLPFSALYSACLLSGSQTLGLDDELFSLIAPRRHVSASAPRTDVDAHTSRWYVGSNASQWTVKKLHFHALGPELDVLTWEHVICVKVEGPF